MPVRSLTSSVLRWPDASEVDRAVRAWAASVARRPDVLAVGYFGSYARGDWGVGSDVDLVVVVGEDQEPAVSRPAHWDTTGLPVPADVLVYTREEWDRLPRAGRFYQTLREEAVWVYVREGFDPWGLGR